MRKFLNGLVLGVLLGAGGVWYYFGTHAAPGAREAERQAARHAKQALESAQAAAGRAKQALAAKLEVLGLRASEVEKEFMDRGRVVRRSAREAGEAVADAAADARITAAVKAKLAVDPELSALAISVDTTAGRVTLAGTAASPELVGRAMVLALETEGVREVVATLQVKPVTG